MNFQKDQKERDAEMSIYSWTPGFFILRIFVTLNG